MPAPVPCRRALLVLLGTVALYGVSFADRIDVAAIAGPAFRAKLDPSRQVLLSPPLWFLARRPVRAPVWLGEGDALLVGLHPFQAGAPAARRPASPWRPPLSSSRVSRSASAGRVSPPLACIALAHAASAVVADFTRVTALRASPAVGLGGSVRRSPARA